MEELAAATVGGLVSGLAGGAIRGMTGIKESPLSGLIPDVSKDLTKSSSLDYQDDYENFIKNKNNTSLGPKKDNTETIGLLLSALGSGVKGYSDYAQNRSRNKSYERAALPDRLKAPMTAGQQADFINFPNRFLQPMGMDQRRAALQQRLQQLQPQPIQPMRD